MTYVLRHCILCAGRAIFYSPCRGFVATPACLVRGRIHSSEQRKTSSVQEKLLKDSDFIDIEEECVEPDLNESKLGREFESQIKKEKRKLWKILTKKKMEISQKSPNMLTSSEREHMKYLHKSDPDYWTPENLSESFPALPYVIRKILKNKWSYESLESIKKADAIVLENWEKLKRNELEAPPAVLEHLKKFVNRRDTLKAQLENPKFFPEIPTVPKLVTWKEGPLKKLITQYEREVERVKKMNEESKMVAAGSRDELVVQNEKKNNIIEEIKAEAEARQTEDDSFIIGRLKRRDKEVTLDELKKNIFEKTEKKKKISTYEKLVLDKTLQRDKRNKEKVKVEKESDKLSSSGSHETEFRKVKEKAILNRILKNATKVNDSELPTNMTGRTPDGSPTTDSETDPDLREDDTRILYATQLGQFLYPTKEEDVQVEEKKPEPKPRVNYYGTEKDKEMVERDIKLLSNTSFWCGTIQPRSKSKDALSVENNKLKTNPHLSPTIKTYFTYDYPERIEIPEDKWKKGKIYRVKDCFYDDNGEFLYRVPGKEAD